MQNTIQITIEVSNAELNDILVARLSALDYDAFEEKENELDAFIEETFFDAAALKGVLNEYKVNYSKSFVEHQNWNALWESSSQPVMIDDFCVVRADFHPPFPNTEHEIIITPKMSFGTGHHATTYLMISEMRHLDFKNKQVADFGTGTGVLAILAEKQGSKYVWAIDYDEWSITNSKENTARNSCKNIVIENAAGFHPKQQFDIILANINRNIILENVESLVSGLYSQGKLLLSGLLQNDESEVIFAFVQKGFRHISTVVKNNWICILLHKE